MGEIFAQDTVTYVAAIATIIGTVVAILGLIRYRRGNNYKVGGDSHFQARDIAGSNVVINTGSSAEAERVDYSKEDQRTEWKIYEAAFLWHDLEPPGTAAHFQSMNREVEAIKEMLHAAAASGELPISREAKGPGGVTRWVTRDALVELARLRGARPKFLFPESR